MADKKEKDTAPSKKEEEEVIEEDEEDKKKRIEEEKRARLEKAKKRKDEQRLKAEEKGSLGTSVQDLEATASTTLREDLIANSVNFLLHPKVRNSAVSQKTAFLQKKGLTQAEITEAFSRANIPTTPTTGATSTAVATRPAPGPAQPQQYNQPQQYQQYAPPPQQLVPAAPSFWNTRMGFIVTIVASIAFGASLMALVKRFVIPWLNGDSERRAKKREELEKRRKEEDEQRKIQQKLLEDVSATLKLIQTQNSELKDSIKSVVEQSMQQLESKTSKSSDFNLVRLSLNEVSSELKTVKAMVMDNKNFAPWKAQTGTSGSVPTTSTTPTIPPKALPSWQMEGKVPATAPPTTTALGNNSLADPQSVSSKEEDPFTKMVKDTKPASAPQTTTTTTSGTGDIPYSNGFKAIAEMVKKGIVPSDVRTDIDDKPLEADPQLEQGRRSAPPKPWLKQQQNSAAPSSPAESAKQEQ